jgi:glycosyltransferase involved in cell wall biosynthesis
MKPKQLNIIAFIRACKLIKGTDILQTWMYHANLFGYLIKKVVKVNKLIWGIRHSNLDKDKNKSLTLKIVKICAKLSKKVDIIISCSKVATKVHIDYGYFPDNIVTIPNGFEIDKFYYDEKAKKKLLNELAIISNPFVISLVGRWDVLKDHKNFFQALRLVNQAKDDFVAILCGDNINYNNKKLMNLMSLNYLHDKVFLLGRRNDIPKIMSASDILVSSSSGEGFSNVIGEAMACEVPCVVTNVGDSAYIVGKTGLVVEKQDPKQLAKAILKMMEMEKEELRKLGKEARKRIMENFDIIKITEKYENLY